MDFRAEYCQTRRTLENQGWVLVSRHAELTARLLQLTGQDHVMFLDTLNNCRTIAQKIAAAHIGLQEHRRDHGC